MPKCSTEVFYLKGSEGYKSLTFSANLKLSLLSHKIRLSTILWANQDEQVGFRSNSRKKSHTTNLSKIKMQQWTNNVISEEENLRLRDVTAIEICIN